ncbi:MAG: HAD-IIB family hydrolase [Alphaproteobacteria bacterium]|nr:HAD-IIB family hydrolase [Alphaproteobacteria bacterium]
MQPFAFCPQDRLRSLLGVFTDIDDTLTLDGRLPAIAYAALERLQGAGLMVVPVTGRPAGWCDLIARFWPIDGVVGENGAFYFRYDRAVRRMIRVFVDDEATRATYRKRLEGIGRTILAAVPGAAISADQLYRETDLAIDFAEDVGPLDQAEIERIKALFEATGATAKISSIHVNGWFGSYDKLAMTKRFVAETLGRDLEGERERFLFLGDSPNDQPLFGFFPLSVGVANVRAFAGRLTQPPSYVTEKEGGFGFAEAVDWILKFRSTP